MRIISVPTIASEPGNGAANRLVENLPGVSIHQPERKSLSRGVLEAVVHQIGGEDAREQRAQRSARAVDAEGIERIVIAEDLLHRCQP